MQETHQAKLSSGKENYSTVCTYVEIVSTCECMQGASARRDWVYVNLHKQVCVCVCVGEGGGGIQVNLESSVGTAV